MILDRGGDAEKQAAELRACGWLVYLLPPGIADKASFFEGVRAVLPLDPPLVGNQSWDALSDSVWAGLDQTEGKRIAIVWPQARLAVPELQTAVRILEDLTESLSDMDATSGSPKEICIVIT